VLTNTTPTPPIAAPAWQNVSYLIERLWRKRRAKPAIDAGSSCGRRKPDSRRKHFPYKPPIAMSTYDSGDPPGLLHEVLKSPTGSDSKTA